MIKIMMRLGVENEEKVLNIKERTRGQNLSFNRKSFKRRRRNDFAFFVGERHNFFVYEVVISWNILPQNVINSSSLNTFKAALDKFTKKRLFKHVDGTY